MISTTTTTAMLYLFLIYLLHRVVSYFLALRRMYRILAPVSGPGAWESFSLVWNILYGRSFTGAYSPGDPIGTRVSRQARELCDRYGGTKGVVKVGYGLFPPYLYVCEGKLAKEILKNPAFQNKANIHSFLGAVVTGNGLLTCDGAQAQVYRTELKRHFYKQTLETYLDTFQKHLGVLEGKIGRIIDSKAETGVIEDIKPTISTLVMDSIGENIFSIDFNSQSDPKGEPSFVAAIEHCLTAADGLLVQQWKTISTNFIIRHICSVLDPTFWRLLALVRQVAHFKNSMILLVVKLYWKVWKSRSKAGEGDYQPASMMEAVVDRQISKFKVSGLSPLTFYTGFRDAFWHLSIFMLAGHQTSTMTLTWALYYLCRHEQVRQKLQEEVDDFLKNKEENSPQEMTEVLTDKSALKYLEAVIKETMRLAPAGPYLGRKAAADVTLPVNFADDSGGGGGGEEPTKFISIPAGTDVIVMSQYMHYSERYFREAGSFIPERWLLNGTDQGDNETEAFVPPPCYNPFSAGTRACIGDKYAMLQMKLALLSICSKFDFTFAHPDTTFCEPQHHMVQGPARFAIKFSHRKKQLTILS